jgi:hypothetical protein
MPLSKPLKFTLEMSARFGFIKNKTLFKVMREMNVIFEY